MDGMIKYGVVRRYVNKKKKLLISFDSLTTLSLIIEDVLEAACDKAIRNDARKLKPEHFKNLTIKLKD